MSDQAISFLIEFHLLLTKFSVSEDPDSLFVVKFEILTRYENSMSNSGTTSYVQFFT